MNTKIKIKVSCAVDGVFYNSDDTALVSKKRAKDLIQQGIAKNVVSNKKNNGADKRTSVKSGIKKQSKVGRK